jgi:hypothetical protein
MPRRIAPSFADYVVIALSPALIMVLVGSLVFFLIEVFYLGQYDGRLNFIMALFIFAAVLIARIAIERGREYAMLFSVPLGLVTALATFRLVEYGGPLRTFSALINVGLIGLIWWCADRLTWDSTVIDESQDASGEGLLQTVGLDRQPDTAETAVEATTSRERITPSAWQRFVESRRRPHAPGVWVIYFSLAALPIFGFGNWFVASTDLDARRYVFRLLVTYVAAALGLLLTTSFLGLRRYLRQRRLEMPMEMAASWIGSGAVMIVALLLLSMLLPRRNAEYSVTHLPFFAGSPTDLWTTEYAAGNEGEQDPQAADRTGESGSDQAESESKADGQTRDGQGESAGGKSGAKDSQQGGSDGQGKSGQGKSGQGKSGQGKSGQGKSGQGKSADGKSQQGQSGQGQSGQGQSGQGKSEQGQSGQGQSGQGQSANGKSEQGESGQDKSGQGRTGGRSDEEKSDQDQSGREPRSDSRSKQAQSSTQDSSERQKTSQTQQDRGEQDQAESEARSKRRGTSGGNERVSRFDPSKLGGAAGGAVGQLIKLAYWAAILLLVGWLMWRFRREISEAVSNFMRSLRELWNSLFGRRRDEPVAAEQSTASPSPPPKPFSSFQDPFQTGMAHNWPPSEVIRYSFEAFEAWGRERGFPREPRQTPHEYVQVVGRGQTAVARAAATLAELYCRCAYGRESASRASVEPLRQLWAELRAGI